MSRAFLAYHIPTGSTGGIVSSNSGAILHTIVVNNVGTAATVIVYDGTSASGAVVASLSPPVAGGNYIYDVTCNTGIFVVTTGSPDITVTYS